MNKNYFKSIAVLVGTILGAGIFAVPFVVQKAGILSLLIYFPALFFIQLTLHLIYAEIILTDKNKHRMVGFVGIYYNKFFKRIAFLIAFLGKQGTLLVYIILGGIFLHQLLNPWLGGTKVFYTTILFLGETLIVLFGLKMIARVEFILTILTVIVIFGLSWEGLAHWEVDNYTLLNWGNLLLPYGAIFFAIGGQPAIPEVCQLLKEEKRKIHSAIFWGTFLPIILIALFAFLVIGVTGVNTTSDTLIGLSSKFSSEMMRVALVFGLLAIITSYIVISQSLREIYHLDLGINKNFSWLLATMIPFGLYLLGVRNLTSVIGLTGAITGGLYGIILILVYFKVQNKNKRRKILKKNLNRKMAFILSLAFILGMIWELINFMNV